MKRYDTIDRLKDNKSLLGEEIWAFNKLDGQNLGVKFNARTKQFTDFTSRNCNVDETHEQFGGAVRFFKENYEENLRNVLKTNSSKGKLFQGVEEITLFFEWYGNQSFAGFHVEGDEMHLALIDVFLKKKGYIEPKPYYEIFSKLDWLEIPELVYKGKLNMEFANSIVNNDPTKPDCQYPCVKEGVVCRRSTMLKGQVMPKCKIKTQWWLDELHRRHTPEECKLLE